MEMVSDVTLWSSLKQGDYQALEHIYNREVDYLYNYSKKITTDVQLIEDSIQDLFVYLWDKRYSLSDTTSIRAYLIVALRRRIIKVLGKLKRTADQSEIEKNKDESLNFQDFLISIENTKEKSTEIKLAIEKLSNRQKEIIYLKFYLELEYEDICEAMEISYQSARNLNNSALTSLRKHLLTIINFIIFVYF